MAIDPITLKLVIDVISSILPFGHIAKAWSDFLNYRGKKLEINYKIIELEKKVPLIKDYIKSKTQIELQRLRNEKHKFDKRMIILQDQLTNITLEREQIIQVIKTLNKKLSDARGDDLKYITQAISYTSLCLTKQTVSVFEILEKEIGLQQTSIDSSIKSLSQIENNTLLIERGNK